VRRGGTEGIGQEGRNRGKEENRSGGEELKSRRRRWNDLEAERE
jgi:hypothetical protein